ncbi:hypothetical protein K504DRAFT_288689 [Pleomassaria siparia CBS 279.74]|uniref:Uncharacterized protein n=1 Tax=Pleomassaria siparia CBS 279.74 TaxID=1314801 RepID=A0A6G1K7H9_9PLEO|nr:hypothetical protein K504DRAFT_288689 [Pleomassaria siparia CBS 279.74]
MTKTTTNRIVPAVPLVKSQHSIPETSSRSTFPLNPDAPTFKLDHSEDNSLRAAAHIFVPEKTIPSFSNRSPFQDITNASTTKMEPLDFDKIESFKTEDLTDATSQSFAQGVQYVSESDTFVFTYNTHDLQKSAVNHDLVARLASTNKLPHKVQLNILTGPRLQQVHKVAHCFAEAMGTLMCTVRQVQIAIVRCGENISNKWIIPTIELEGFPPLHNFVAELLQVLPRHANIIWGASDILACALRKYYLAIAVPAHQNAIEKEEHHDMDSYSECISSATLKNIGARFLHIQGKKLHPAWDSQPSTTSYTFVNPPALTTHRSGVTSRALSLNQNAEAFRSAPTVPFELNPSVKPFIAENPYVYDHGTPFYLPTVPYPVALHRAMLPPVYPYDPFQKQIREVDASRYGSISNQGRQQYISYNPENISRHNPQHDSRYTMYGTNENIVPMFDSTQVHYPPQMCVYTPPSAYTDYNNDGPVYATAPHLVQQRHEQQPYRKQGKKHNSKYKGHHQDQGRYQTQNYNVENGHAPDMKNYNGRGNGYPHRNGHRNGSDNVDSNGSEHPLAVNGIVYMAADPRKAGKKSGQNNAQNAQSGKPAGKKPKSKGSKNGYRIHDFPAAKLPAENADSRASKKKKKGTKGNNNNPDGPNNVSKADPETTW